MATDSMVAGLFQDPQQYQQAMLQQQMKQNYDIAQMSPEQQVTGGLRNAGSQIGGALAGLMGVQDPQMQLMAMRKQVLQGLDPTDAASIGKAAQALAQAGDQQGAMQLAQKALEVRNTESQISGRTEEKQAQRDLQKQLQTQKDQAALERLQEKLTADMQREKERGASDERLARMQIEGRKEIAQLAASFKGSQPKNLPASLQKDEGKDLETIDTYTGQVDALKPALDALTPNDKGVRKLELGPLKNLKYEAQLAAGNSSPEARSYEGLKSAVDTAVNLQVSAEKGVQTDKDVLRFAKALIAAYGRNDTEATYQALKRYQESIVAAQGRAKGRVESRRKSQGVDPYYVNDTAQQPLKRIKLD
jgi:hypothetical protein